MNGWRPVELTKLCCNELIKQIYHEDQKVFLGRLKTYNLPEDIHNHIFERYKFIRFIYKYD